MVDILKRVWGIVERIRMMDSSSLPFLVIFGIVLLFGILNCFLGYRLLRFWMMLCGFVMGALAGVWIVHSAEMSGVGMYAAGALLGGIILSIFAFFIYIGGIFILGAGMGITLSIYVLHPTTSLSFFLCILAGVGIGVLATKFAKIVMILGTSIIGGILAGFSVAEICDFPELPYGVLMSLGFALLGVIIQFAINKEKEYLEDDDEEDEEEDYELKETSKLEAEEMYTEMLEYEDEEELRRKQRAKAAAEIRRRRKEAEERKGNI